MEHACDTLVGEAYEVQRTIQKRQCISRRFCHLFHLSWSTLEEWPIQSLCQV